MSHVLQKYRRILWVSRYLIVKTWALWFQFLPHPPTHSKSKRKEYDLIVCKLSSMNLHLNGIQIKTAPIQQSFLESSSLGLQQGNRFSILSKALELNVVTEYYNQSASTFECCKWRTIQNRLDESRSPYYSLACDDILYDNSKFAVCNIPQLTEQSLKIKHRPFQNFGRTLSFTLTDS